MKNRLFIGLALILNLASPLAHSGELIVRETMIIGTTTSVPGTNETFQDFGVLSRPVSAPAIHDGYVVFWGKHLDPDNQKLSVHGLFRYSQEGGIERLVDSKTIMPGKSQPFEDITEFSTNEGNVAFLGARLTEGFEGVYSLMNGNLQVVADPTVSLPGLSGPDNIFWHPLIESDRIAFVTPSGIFQSQNSTLQPLVLSSEAIPGMTESFQRFGNISFDNGVLRFFGLGPLLGTGNVYDWYEGIFTKSSMGLTTVVDVFTPIPEGTGNFLSFRAIYPCGGATLGYSLCSAGPVHQNGQIAFAGWDSTLIHQGLYISFEGTLTKVADHLSVLPGASSAGAYYDQPTIDQGGVAFTADNHFSGQQGVYFWDGEEIHEVYNGAGGTLGSLRLGPQGLHRNQLVFSVVSADGSEAIRIVELIRPTTIQASQDSFVYRKSVNRNEGSHPSLIIGRDRSSLRSVATFDLRGISMASVNKAQIIVELQEPVRDIGSHGKPVQVQALFEGFEEGNGKNYGFPRRAKIVGYGSGVTWNCSADNNISNKKRNCDVMWLGGSLVAGPMTDEVLHVDGQIGQVIWDVTVDVVQALANGKTEVSWLFRFADEDSSGIVKYHSKEGAAEQNNSLLAPQLRIE